MSNPTPGDVHVPGPVKGRRLKNLRLNRSDLVESPANLYSKVVLIKGEDSLEKHIAEENGQYVVYSQDRKKRLGSYKTKDEAVARLRQVEAYGKAAAGADKDGAKKTRNGIPPNLKAKYGTLEDMAMDINYDELPEDVRKHLEHLEAQREELASRVDELTAEVESAAVAGDPVAKADVAKLAKALEDERSARLAGEERIAKMEAERKLLHFTAVAKADFEPLGAADELGEMLLVVSEAVPAETFQTLERTLKAAAAKLASGDLLKQRATVEGHEPSDAESKIDQLAEELVKSGVAKTRELAKLEVIKTHPDLYREYQNARGDR